MNISENVGRWPPIYDFEELGQQIRTLVKDGSIFYQFFDPNIYNKDFFQGDIVSLKTDPIYIDKDGDISIIDESVNYWIILGNTCDLSRELTSNDHSVLPHLTHISPLFTIPKDIPLSILNDMKQYKFYKKVFIPRWCADENDYYIDLTIMNSIEKQYLINHSNITARLNFKTWLLLHSCLVRYLARDDGRND